jgi:hypothetical protein
LALGLARLGVGSQRAWLLHCAAWAIALFGVLAAPTLGVSPRLCPLIALALFSLALGWSGWSLRRAAAP